MKTIKHSIVTITFLLISYVSFGQLNLGTATNFVLFTVLGAFDNVGTSIFSGDIGTDAGAITGFPPGVVSGQLHQANAVTALVAADVEIAYNYLTGIPCDSIIGTTLGSGQVLKGMTYCISAAAVLSGNLIFDGENDPNSLFIIKVNGLLDVSALSKIELINLASISHVQWQINGALNVGDSALIKGIFLINGAVDFANGSKIDGNGLSRQGAITTNGSIASLPTDYGLQIELIKFEGTNKETHNLLSWSTASEINNSYFTLERSSDGIHFSENTLVIGAGTYSSTSNYSFIDYDFERTKNYYRLSQTDYDGVSKIIGILAINNTAISRTIIKMVNMSGQEVAADETGLRVIYFSNGEIKKVIGKYE